MRTMTEIENPRHSRPIDVHRWSDHPEVKALVEHIWNVWLPEEITGKLGVKKTGGFDASGPYRTLVNAPRAVVPLAQTVH